MKKALILSVIFCFIFISCIKETEYNTYYKIINHSSKDIKIRVPNYFRTSITISVDTTFYIPQNQQLEYNLRGAGDDDATKPFKNTDTAFIVFNDKDTIVYTQLDISPHNILKRENYQEEIETKKHKGLYSYFYTYTFTDEDYQNAIKKQ